MTPRAKSSKCSVSDNVDKIACVVGPTNELIQLIRRYLNRRRLKQDATQMTDQLLISVLNRRWVSLHALLSRQHLVVFRIHSAHDAQARTVDHPPKFQSKLNLD